MGRGNWLVCNHILPVFLLKPVMASFPLYSGADGGRVGTVAREIALRRTRHCSNIAKRLEVGEAQQKLRRFALAVKPDKTHRSPRLLIVNAFSKFFLTILRQPKTLAASKSGDLPNQISKGERWGLARTGAIL